MVTYSVCCSQKYLDDQYLFLMVAVITTPILVALIVQVAAFPLTLREHKNTDEVGFALQ